VLQKKTQNVIAAITYYGLEIKICFYDYAGDWISRPHRDECAEVEILLIITNLYNPYVIATFEFCDKHNLIFVEENTKFTDVYFVQSHIIIYIYKLNMGMFGYLYCA